MTNDKALERVLCKCEELKIISFLGWYDAEEYLGVNTRLILKNNNTGEIWNTTTFGNFVNKRNKIIQSKNSYRNRNISEKRRLQEEEVLKRIRIVHDKENWDYSRFEYNGYHKKSTIVCNELDSITGITHGEFKSTPANLISGHGCPKCSGKYSMSTEEFIEKSRIIHNNKYTYEKTVYTNNFSKVIITCPIHGDFLVTPNNHLSKRQGCPKCNNSKGETLIITYLEKIRVNYEYQKSFDSRLFSDIPNVRSVEIDFSIELNNKIYWIEFNGEQHYKESNLFHKDKRHSLQKQVQRDLSIRNYALENGIEFLEIPYLDIDRIPEILQAFLFDGKDITTKIKRDDYSEDF